MTTEDWQLEFGVSVDDHLKQLEAAVQQLRKAQARWEAEQKSPPPAAPASPLGTCLASCAVC